MGDFPLYIGKFPHFPAQETNSLYSTKIPLNKGPVAPLYREFTPNNGKIPPIIGKSPPIIVKLQQIVAKSLGLKGKV